YAAPTKRNMIPDAASHRRPQSNFFGFSQPGVAGGRMNIPFCAPYFLYHIGRALARKNLPKHVLRSILRTPLTNEPVRINREIRARELRVIGADGNNLGVISLAEALKAAETAGLDL